MFGTDGTNDLLFATYAKQLGLGLEEQLKKFVHRHPGTKLIIIDTLQKIREAGGDKYSYANDYEVVGKLKRLADDCGICLLLVHHTRKQQADDKFDMISGTNGLLGAADGAFLLQKEKRTDGSAILDVAGRDQQDQRMYLTKDRERLVWELERLETEPWVEPPDPVLEAVAALVTADRPAWGGTATELAAAIQTDMKPNALAMRLNVRAGRLAAEYHIRYENSRSHAGRSITLPGTAPGVTTVTAVTAFLRAGAVCQNIVTVVTAVTGSGSKPRGLAGAPRKPSCVGEAEQGSGARDGRKAVPSRADFARRGGGDCRKAIQPEPLDFWPRGHWPGGGKGCAFPPCPTASVKV